MLPSRQIVLLAVCIVLFALSVMVADCPADSRTWIGPAGGDWFNAGNWNPYGGPDIFDDLSILSGSPQTTTTVYTGNGGGITLDGSSTSASFDQLVIGDEGTGSLSISNGGSVSNTISWIGYEAGSNGAVTVDGAGSTWTIATELQVGRWGTGTLLISNGGFVQNTDSLIGDLTGSNGTVTVDGAGSTWNSSNELIVGYESTGSLSILNGGSVSSTTNWIGCEAGSNGTVTVDGTGSTWTNATQLQVGRWGTGTLQISNGGFFQSTDSWIGDLAGSNGTVTVDGAGSTWSNSNDLIVGYESTGSLSISNGGSVSNDGTTWIGDGAGSNGTVTVDGAGSTWINSDQCINIGYLGTGTLTVSSGGQVSSADAYVGRSGGSTGTVTVDGTGSLWVTNSGSLCVGGSDTDSGGTGELTVSGGSSVKVGDMLKVWGGGTLNIGATGQVAVAQAIVLKQDSTLTTEAGAVIHMTGSAFKNESTNSANLAGLGNLTMIFEGGTGVVDPFEAGGYDDGAVVGGFVTANFLLGTLQLGGSAAGRIQLVDEFDNQDDGNPGTEAVYVHTLIMNAGATIDTNGLNLYYLNDGDPKQFFCGDADLDGDVDAADYGNWQAGFGETTGGIWVTGDFDGDGDVDATDYGTWQASFGSTTFGGVSVPEPTTLFLLCGAAVPVVLKRSRKSRA